MNQRERFEAAYPVGLSDLGTYDDPTQAAWLAFQEAERQTIERCAKACEEQEYYYINRDMSTPPELAGDAPEGCRGCADAIRALGEEDAAE